jgi:putative peptide zinc metalloprotease protein
MVISGIIWAIATQFFAVGVMIAVTTTIAWAIVPLWKAIKYLRTSPRLRPVRARALGIAGGFVGCLVMLPMWVPVPLNSMSEGVVWLPEEGIVRAEVEGWVKEELSDSDARVAEGDPVMRLDDEFLDANLAVAIAREEELLATIQGHRPTDVVSMEVAKEQLHTVRELLAELQKDKELLTIRTLSDGVFHLTPGPEHAGRFVQRGEVIGTVMERDNWQVLALVHQDEIDLIRSRSGVVQVRFADELEEIYTAVVIRETPTASKDLPSGAFATAGGGEVLLDPLDPSGRQAFERWFQLEMDVPHKEGEVRVGGRVHVRFLHGVEPVGKRWYRSLRRLFLSEFGL